MAIYTNNNEFTPQISTGEKIKKYRLNNNLSQVDVARMMKKSPVWLSKIETDQREIKVNDLVKICKIFQIDISELLGINKNNSGYKTVLQNVLSNLPNEIPVYRTQELEKLFITKEPVNPTMYAYWDPNIFTDEALGLFIDDDSNAPELNPGDRVYINSEWQNNVPFGYEDLLRRVKNNTLWLLEILPSSKSLICNDCGGKQDHFNRPKFEEEYSCLCSKGFTIARAKNDEKHLSFFNNYMNLDCYEVRMIGRLVQIIKEL